MTDIFDQSTWMTSPWPQDDPEQPRHNPIFRKTISLPEAIEAATINICGLGHYELFINGTRVGDRQLEPAFTDYDKRVLYSMYEISDLLVAGENVFTLYLGRGRYNMNTVSVWGYENAPWRGPLQFIVAGEITTADNQTITQNGSGWKCTEGPIYRDSMYGGEGFDARLEPDGWQIKGFDDSAWEQAVPIDGPVGELQSSAFDPIRIVKELPVAETLFADSNRIVVDFGDMLAGNVRIRVQEPAGTRIHIAYAEKRDGTQVIRGQNLIDNTWFQEDDYICKGDAEEIWHARFSYKGFRYVEISGFTDTFTADQVTALVMHNDVKQRGSFECSNAFANKLHQACATALLNNLHHIVTDTPTFEKNGWTGDAQLTAPMGLYNFDIASFYRKYVTDLRDSQIASGELAPIVPTSGWGLTDNPNSKWDKVLGAVPAWDAALFVMSWEVYQFSGDPAIIKENYAAMQAYIAYLGEVADGHIVDMGLGDWLPPNGDPHSPHPGDPSEGPSISSTAWYYKLTDILYQSAVLLQDEVWQKRCMDIKDAVYAAFNERFLNEAQNGYESGTETEYRQTSNILALAFDLVPEEHKANVLAASKQHIQKDGSPKLNAGILGTRYAFEVLSDSGDVDLAWDLITSEEYPSWGYWFANGFVSLGEMWEITSRSWSHHMFGSVDAWFYRYLAGINAASPGFTHVAITPHVPSKLDAYKASIDLEVGIIVSEYQRVNGDHIFDVTLPVDCEGTFALPVGLPGITLDSDFAANGCTLIPGENHIVINSEGKTTLTS